VTDPPYGLGFRGKAWDGTGITYNADVWRECLRVLKPGGHLLAFGGSRTYHRMACAIEDAGFEIRDQIMWVYGQGFPKSHNISKAIDKQAGAEREILGTIPDRWAGKGSVLQRSTQAEAESVNITAPATPEAQQWDGWGTALKPAHEPIVLARKPFAGAVADNVLAWGTGGINVDGCRVGYINEADKNKALAGDAFKRKNTSDKGWSRPWMEDKEKAARINAESKERAQQGRFPANLIHDGSDEVTGLFPNDTARFFYCAKASKCDRDEGLPEGAHSHHPTVKPTDLMRYLCRLVTPPAGIVLDPFMGSGSTGKAAALEGFDFIGIEQDAQYIEIARRRIEHAAKQERQLTLEV